MTKNEFIDQLRNRLEKLPAYELEKTIAFYNETIDDRIEEGMSEEEAVADLGSIDEIVNEILIDTPLSSLIQGKIKENHKKSKNRTLWMVLAICGFPFWLVIGILFVTMILVFYICIWSVVVSLYAAEAAFALAGVSGVVAGITICATRDVPAGLALIGVSIASFGLFLATIKPLIWLCKQLIKLTGVFLRKVKSLFIKKEV